ncbi:MAG TPA: hypothetical protein PKI77_18415 [Mycobacterium sp.]|nr:hypothetical protein [Mycobacterium sp.]
MPDATENRILADTGGLLVSDDGRRVVVIDRRTGGLSTLAFVLGVTALVVGGFGLVVTLTGLLPGSLGIVLLGAGLVLSVVTFLILRAIRERRAQPLAACRPVAVLDRKLGLFSYPDGPLLPIDQVRFERRLQIGSSSPKLVAVSPAGTRVIKRGNPFDGGVARVDEILNEVVRGG